MTSTFAWQRLWVETVTQTFIAGTSFDALNSMAVNYVMDVIYISGSGSRTYPAGCISTAASTISTTPMRSDWFSPPAISIFHPEPAASGNTLTGTGSDFTAAGTLVRTECSVIVLTNTVQVFQITGVTSATQLAVSPATNPAIPAGTRYSILLSDLLSVDGLALDITKTFKNTKTIWAALLP